MEAHGSFRLERRGQVLIGRLRESWNEHTAEAYRGAVLNHAEELAGQPWAIINDLRGWRLATLECAEIIEDLARRLDAMNRTHAAFLVGELEDLIRFGFDLSVGRGSRRVVARFFHEEEAVVAWLRGVGFDIE